jgi:hypothetical protein
MRDQQRQRRASDPGGSAPAVPHDHDDPGNGELDDTIEASFPASDPPSWTTNTATVTTVASARARRKVVEQPREPGGTPRPR